MAASNGTMVAVGIRSRRTYSVEVYIPELETPVFNGKML